MPLAELVGYAAAFLTTCSFIPQAWLRKIGVRFQFRSGAARRPHPAGAKLSEIGI
jgi:hypothetical protein